MPKVYKLRTKQQRLFECQVCGTRVSAPKRHGYTLPGHIKTMYCYKCKKTRDHVQID